MTIGVHRSHKSRHLVLRVSSGEMVPDVLATAFRQEQVNCGWLSGSGVLADVELRAYDTAIGTLGSARRIEGPVHVLSLEGTIGRWDSEASLSLRAVLGRESDRGLETVSGEIVSARAIALEVFVTVLDDVALRRTLDEAAGVWLLAATADAAAASHLAPNPTAPAAWSAALDASDRTDHEPRARSPQAPRTQNTTAGMPTRPGPPRPEQNADDPCPEQGDAVDHFAFGPCDVLKSDGDRLHIRVHKGGRIREIALAMLRVSRVVDADDGKRRFKLERRM